MPERLKEKFKKIFRRVKVGGGKELIKTYQVAGKSAASEQGSLEVKTGHKLWNKKTHHIEDGPSFETALI